MKKAIFMLLALCAALPLDAQSLRTGDELLDRAFALAIRTVDDNTDGLLLKAGGGYGGEWTRDIAINSWNGASLLRPEAARHSLWSVTVELVAPATGYL